jgi:diguanylate cyclase (GGDEF)-like protein
MDRSDAHRALDRARAVYHEDHDGALAEAIRCQEIARTLDDDALRCRALVIEAAVMLERGDLRGAVARTGEAEAHAERSGGNAIRAELAAVQAQLHFFAGAYGDAMPAAERAIELADRAGDVELRLFARRCACVVFGNVGVRDWQGKVEEVLRIAVDAGNRWEEALSRNDVAHMLMEKGDLDAAERQIAAAFSVAAGLAPHNRFALAVLNCTRSEIRLNAGRLDDALTDAQRAVDLLAERSDPNPYLLAMSVVIEVQALLALGRLDEAERSGQRTVERLGERVPQARSMILRTVAAALREAGRTEEAYDVLAHSAEVDRGAFQELCALQRDLERARLETLAAREQAERDPLTGLHNRRYLAREFDRHAGAPGTGPFSVAVLDLDDFKGINDRYGHQAGDEVLMRVAALLLGEMRAQDVVVRAGGEEFLLLMPMTDAAAAAACCERLCSTIRAHDWDRMAPGLAVTASVGVATAADAGDLAGLAALADERLYEAKRAGRDRVVV